MAKISYANKETLNEQTSIADKNKVKASDMNEIKTSVNDLYDTVSAQATSITNLQTYSTTETNTGQKWKDGKDIYRKVIVVNSFTTGSNEIATGLSGISEYISVYGIAYITNGMFPIPKVHNSSFAYQIGIYVANNKVYVEVGSSVTNLTNGYVIVEYTKS